MELHERIKAVRKHNNLTQAQFGARIGIKGNTVTGYENNIRTPSDAILLSICRVFGIDQNWMFTGEGQPYLIKDTDQELEDILSQIQVKRDEFVVRMLKAYWYLPEEHNQIVRNLIEEIAGK